MLKSLFSRYFLLAFLLFLAGLLQYQLWFQPGGINNTQSLKRSIAHQQEKNQKLQHSNRVILANVNDLKHGQGNSEALSREELGMIKPDETYYQILN